MAMSSPKPIVVTVPESAYTLFHWALFIDCLENPGWPTLTATLPSVAPEAPVAVGEEAAYVRERTVRPCSISKAAESSGSYTRPGRSLVARQPRD